MRSRERCDAAMRLYIRLGLLSLTNRGMCFMTTIGVIGLGYVGLPLAVEFGKKFRTIGFDLSAEKVAAYGQHFDPTGEVASEDLRAATQLSCHTDASVTREADFIVVAVPTPVDDAHQPDFRPWSALRRRLAAI